jgi:hypothetical protein
VLYKEERRISEFVRFRTFFTFVGVKARECGGLSSTEVPRCVMEKRVKLFTADIEKAAVTRTAKTFVVKDRQGPHCWVDGGRKERLRKLGESCFSRDAGCTRRPGERMMGLARKSRDPLKAPPLRLFHLDAPIEALKLLAKNANLSETGFF